MGLNELRDTVTRIAKEHGFLDASVGEDLMLIVTEVAEAMEAYRENSPWLSYECRHPDGDCGCDNDPKCVDGSLHKPVGINSEIADIIIRCLHFCGKHGIDIDRAVREKTAYNETRPFKHGKQL